MACRSPGRGSTRRDARQAERFQARSWATLAPVTNLSLNTRLTWEARNYLTPASPYALHGFNLDEALLDTLKVEWADFHRPNVGWGCNPTKRMEVAADYSALIADHNPRGRGISGAGHFREHLLTSVLRYSFKPHVKGCLLGEWFWPGNRYATPALKDLAMFSRAEVSFTWKASRLTGRRRMEGLGTMRVRFDLPSLLVFLVAGGLVVDRPAWAIVLLSSGDPDRNTTPPSGVWADSGWQWQGDWHGFVGTPIAANLFVTAKHVGGIVGDALVWAGAVYRTVGSFPDPESDLAIWRICGAFPSHAPMVGADAVLSGERCVVFGRGMIRGAELVATNQPPLGLRGWEWAAGGGRLRWGLNTIATNGAFVEAPFDNNRDPDEATLAAGDSGGALFVRQDDQWRLAGIHYAVDGPFRQSAQEPGFFAALFDTRGFLEEEAPSQWLPVADGPTPKPVSFYSTSVAARRAWIDRVIADYGDPGQPWLEAADTPAGPYAAAMDATVQPGGRVFRVPRAGGARFFRLGHCVGARIDGVRATTEYVELTWSAL